MRRSAEARLCDEIREIIEGIHGRPRRKRGVVIVISNVLCTDNVSCWIAKAKIGSTIVAKCGTPPCGHFTVESALQNVLSQTKLALGVRP